MSTIECAFFGALGRDAEIKTSKAGKSYLRLNVRVGDGDDATWVNVLSFDPEAIAAAERLVKGCKVYIEGTLRLDKWTAQDRTEKQGLSVMARLTRLPAIGQNKPKRERNGSNTEPARNDFHSDEVGF